MTDQQDPMARNKALARAHLRLVWQASQRGGELNDEDRRTAEVMREHPEHVHLWEQIERLSDDEITKDGTNPILHIMMHTAVENQIAGSDPPETGQAVAVLERRGLSHHEAVHRMASALTDELWHMMREQRLFDPARYAAMVAELLRSRATPPTNARAKWRIRLKRRR